jgi:ParB/RepB/Spo0J family partition protein
MASAVQAPPDHAAATQFQILPVSACKPSGLNPRKLFDHAKLLELAQTMGNGVGVIEPIVVRTAKSGYEIVAGDRRVRAAKLAGLTEVPAVIKNLTDGQVLEIMVIENDAREDVNALERADDYKRLLTFGFDIDKLAGRLGHSRKWVYDQIKLLELIPEAQTLLLAHHMSPAHAILIARLTPEQQAKVVVLNEDDRFGPHPDHPLFERDHGLLTDAEEDAEDEAQKRDPYIGLKTKSVRELEAWIANHCRFDPAAPINVELFPQTAAAVEEADKVVSITHNHHVRPDAKDGNNQRIYSTVSWKRADGLLKSKTCDRSVTGVIVVGPGRGEAFKVCVHKECDTHWKTERQAKAKAAKSSGGDNAYLKRMADEQAKREERYRQEEVARAAWKKASPAVLQACAAQIKTVKAPALADLLARRLRAPEIKTARTLLKVKGSSAEDLLRVLAFAVLVTECEGGWNAYADFPALAKKTIGLDLRPVLKKVTTTSQPSQAKTAKASKKR